MPAPVQITAEQLLREAKERELELVQPVSMQKCILFLLFFYRNVNSTFPVVTTITYWHREYPVLHLMQDLNL